MSRHCAAASLTRRDREILRIIWRQETSSVRSILEALPVNDKPAYTTIQTIVHRLARKGAVRRAGRRRKADLFVAAIARSTVVRQWIDDCMALAEGHEHLVVSHLANYGLRAVNVGLKGGLGAALQQEPMEARDPCHEPSRPKGLSRIAGVAAEEIRRTPRCPTLSGSRLLRPRIGAGPLREE